MVCSAIVYLAVASYLYFRQSKLLYLAPGSYAQATPAAIGLPFEDLRIPVSRDHVHAWWIPGGALSRHLAVVFHGNGYVIEDTVGSELGVLSRIGVSLLMVDYRGYGSSTSIAPDESTVNQDGEAVLDYILRRRGVPAGGVFLLGRSIGSGPATYLAQKNPGLGGLILESPFTSIEEAASHALPYVRIFPLTLMLRTHFDNLSRIGSVSCPVLIVAGTADTLTPPWMAERLFARARQPKELYMVRDAGHNDLPQTGGSQLVEVLQRFVRRER